MGYKRSFYSGFTLNGALKLSSKVIAAIKIWFLARLLTPTDFGLFSLVLVSVSLIEVFTESGINVVLVQSQKKIEEYIDTAWIFSIFRGLVICGVMILLAFSMSSYYNEPNLLNLILFASLVPIIKGFINPGIITFYKELNFKKDTMYRFALVITDFVVAIIGGLILKNTYALVIPLFFSAAVDVYISFKYIPIKPQFKFSLPIFKEIFAHSKWLNGISILDYLNKNVDNLIIGRMLGTASLGLYQNAFALSQSLTAEIGLSAIHASFPIYARLSEDAERLRRSFFKVASLFSLLTLVPTIILIIFPELIIRLQFGDQWLSAIAILPILALAGYVQGFLNIGSTIFTVKKKYYMLSLSLGITLISLVIGLMVLSPRYGLVGSALSVLISRLITLPIFFGLLVSVLRNEKK
jgi:O-antigen/teichoic acid export membrane protein